MLQHAIHTCQRITITPLPITSNGVPVHYAGACSGSHPPRQDGEEKNSQDVNMDAVESKGATGSEDTEKEANGKKGGDDRVEKDSELEPMDTQQQHSPKAQITAEKVGGSSSMLLDLLRLVWLFSDAYMSRAVPVRRK